MKKEMSDLEILHLRVGAIELVLEHYFATVSSQERDDLLNKITQKIGELANNNESVDHILQFSKSLITKIPEAN